VPGPKGDSGTANASLLLVRDANGAVVRGLTQLPQLCVLNANSAGNCYIEQLVQDRQWPIDAVTGRYGELIPNAMPDLGAVTGATFATSDCTGAASGAIEVYNSTQGPYVVDRLDATGSDAFTPDYANGTYQTVPAGQYFWDGTTCQDASNLTAFATGSWYPLISLPIPIPADLPAPLTLSTT